MYDDKVLHSENMHLNVELKHCKIVDRIVHNLFRVIQFALLFI